MTTDEAIDTAAARDDRGIGLLRRIASAANLSDDVRTVLQIALDEVCEYAGWPLAHVYFVERFPETHLESSLLWHADRSADMAPFMMLTESHHFQAGERVPGAVITDSGPQWVVDYFDEGNFPRSEAARVAGIRASVCFPVTIGSEIVAVLEFFSRKPQAPDRALMEIMADVGIQLGRAFERERALKSLLESEERARTIVESASDPFIEIDEEGRILSWNLQAEEVFGWKQEEAKGRILSETIIPGSFRKAHEDGLRAFLQTGHGRILRRPLELTALHRDGREFPVELTVWPVNVGGRWSFNAFVRDITERVVTREELQRFNAIDEMTGLQNRREFLSVGQRELSLAERLGCSATLVFMDVDELKVVNDTYGHLEGNELIKLTATLIKETFRTTDLVARLGGDEFCVLETGTTPPQSDRSIERLHQAVEAFNSSGEKRYRLTISAGTAAFDPHAPVGIEGLIDLADKEMYRKKARTGTRPKLLVVDDDPQILRLAQTLFRNDFDVLIAISGAEAEGFVDSHHPDLVILDLALPDTSGVDLAQKIRAMQGSEAVPILMLTGNDGAEADSLRAGIDDFVAKPFEKDVLKARVQNLLHRTGRR